MKSEEATINQRNGIHLRVAAEVVKIAQRHNARVVLSCADCDGADACSIIDVLMLGAPCGRQITITADGPDEDQAVSELRNYFNDGAGI